jgi:antitoxin VapB
MAIARVFRLGNSQAVRLPKAFRFDVTEVEVLKRGDEVVLRRRQRSAWDALARARELGPVEIERPPQGAPRKVRALDRRRG